MALYVGFDASTQSLTAVVVEIEGAVRRVAHQTTLTYDEALPQYGTRHGVLPDPDPAVAVSPPLMWAEALDVVMARLAASDLDVWRIDAISGSAQQHGSVYLSATGESAVARLDPGRPLVGQLRGALSRALSPIWMDTTTAEECAEITAKVGGEATLARHTGSRAFERFTGPQIRRFAKRASADYDATSRIHLISSFMASLLAGANAPLEPMRRANLGFGARPVDPRCKHRPGSPRSCRRVPWSRVERGAVLAAAYGCRRPRSSGVATTRPAGGNRPRR